MSAKDNIRAYLETLEHRGMIDSDHALIDAVWCPEHEKTHGVNIGDLRELIS